MVVYMPIVFMVMDLEMGLVLVKGTGWGLTGRKLSGNSKRFKIVMNLVKVVVKIWVNRQGNVIKAERTQGTTNTNPCLVNPFRNRKNF